MLNVKLCPASGSFGTTWLVPGVFCGVLIAAAVGAGGRLAGGVTVKVAVTVRSCVMLTRHGLVPGQEGSLQPVNVEPLAGLAVSVTEVPEAKSALHVLLQLVIPAGLLDIVPLPAPALFTVRVNCWGWGWSVKVAVTVRA
jgi:hypothetical protein